MLDHLGETEAGSRLEQAVADVSAACKRHQKFWGAPGLSVENIQHLRTYGAQLVAHGGDYEAMLAMLRQAAKELDTLYAS